MPPEKGLVDLAFSGYDDLDAGTVERIRRAHGFDQPDLQGEPARDYKLPWRNLGDFLAKQAAKHGDREHLTFYHNEVPEDTKVTRLTFAELLDRVKRAARVLRALGLRAGDTIATVDLFNHADTVVLLYAAWASGLRVAPINMEEDRERVTFILRDSAARAAFVRAAHAEAFRPIAAQLGIRILVELGDRSTTDWPLLKTLLAKEKPDLAFPDVPLGQEALLVYTSGTTGLPKGCVLTHEMLYDVDAVVSFHAFTERDVFLTAMRLFHVNAVVTSALAAMLAGARLVLFRRWQPRQFWKAANDEEVTTTSVVPAMLADLLRLKGEADPSDVEAVRGRMRALICGAGTLKKAVAEAWLTSFGVRITHGWGMSETTCWGCWLPHDLGEEEYRALMLDREAPSIGTPNRHCRMGIYDAEGRGVAPGQKGQIVIAGRILFARYFQRPDANSEAFKFGVLETGDEGFWVPDKRARPMFFITGRLKDIIERGGEKFSPYTMDDDLSRAPGVRNALVFGFPHNRLGQEVGAVVEAEAGAKVALEELWRHCLALGYSWAKAPKELRIVEQIPKTATGKDTRKAFASLFEGCEDKHYAKPEWWT